MRSRFLRGYAVRSGSRLTCSNACPDRRVSVFRRRLSSMTRSIAALPRPALHARGAGPATSSCRAACPRGTRARRRAAGLPAHARRLGRPGPAHRAARTSATAPGRPRRRSAPHDRRRRGPQTLRARRCAPRASRRRATSRSTRPTTGSAPPGSSVRRPSTATRSTARACRCSPPCTTASKYDNAFWDGQQMVFGDGDGDHLQALHDQPRRHRARAHARGHRAHGRAATTRGSPGALNESMSDVFGSLVKQHSARPERRRRPTG